MHFDLNKQFPDKTNHQIVSAFLNRTQHHGCCFSFFHYFRSVE